MRELVFFAKRLNILEVHERAEKISLAGEDGNKYLEDTLPQFLDAEGDDLDTDETTEDNQAMLAKITALERQNRGTN